MKTEKRLSSTMFYLLFLLSVSNTVSQIRSITMTIVIFTRFNRSHFKYLDTDCIVKQNYAKTRKKNVHKLLVVDVRFRIYI